MGNIATNGAETMPHDSPVSADESKPGAPAGNPTDERLVRLPTVLHTVQTGRTMWLDLVKAGKAPAPVRIGRATFWQMSALQAWIADRVRESRGVR